MNKRSISKVKFYFKILIHTDALNLNTNKKIIHIIKSPNYLVASDSYKLYDIIFLLSDDFKNIKAFFISINIFNFGNMYK